MGSVHASMNKPKQNEDFYGSEPPCIPCPEGKEPGNPGTFEEIHKKVTDLDPQNFEGAKLIVRKTLSQHFCATHSLTFSSVTPSGYKFGANYVGTKRVGMHEKYPVLFGEIMPNGNLNACLTHTIGCRFRVKLSAQIENVKYKALSSSLEYRSDDFTASMTLSNPSILKQQGTLVVHFLQSVTSRIALGVEMACSRGSKIPGYQQTIWTMAGRYSTGPSTLTATLGTAGMHVCFHRRASHQLQLGVELETNFRTHEAVGTIVYQVDLPHANLTFKGIVNSESSIGGVVAKKLEPIPDTSLLISGFYNHKKDQFRVGVGLNVG